MSDASQTIRGYHAHLYAPAEHGEGALRALHARAERELPDVRVGRLHPHGVGPHPIGMFQIAFDPEAIVHVLPWLLHHRADHPVLVHPLMGDARAEHTDHAIWLGEPVALNVGVFD